MPSKLSLCQISFDVDLVIDNKFDNTFSNRNEIFFSVFSFVRVLVFVFFIGGCSFKKTDVAYTSSINSLNCISGLFLPSFLFRCQGFYTFLSTFFMLYMASQFLQICFLFICMQFQPYSISCDFSSNQMDKVK